MIRISTIWDYNDDDVVNKELKALQERGCKIIDIKYSTHGVVRKDYEGDDEVLETQSALIIYDDGMIPEEDRVLTAAELGIK